MSAVGTSCLLDGKVSKFIVRGREVISEQLRDVWVMPRGVWDQWKEMVLQG